MPGAGRGVVNSDCISQEIIDHPWGAKGARRRGWVIVVSNMLHMRNRRRRRSAAMISGWASSSSRRFPSLRDEKDFRLADHKKESGIAGGGLRSREPETLLPPSLALLP